VNSGIDLRPGMVQMSVIYPASPLCSPVSDYQTASPSPTQLEISPRSSVLFLTDTEQQEVTGLCLFIITTIIIIIMYE